MDVSADCGTTPREKVNPALQVELVTSKDAALALLDGIGRDHVLTGYQHPAFVRAWIEAGGSEPVFVTLQAPGHGPVLLPLERSGSHAACYAGDRHANGNFPVGKADDISALGNGAIKALEAHPDLLAAGIHTLMLERQHAVWQGLANPFVDESSVQSPNVALSLELHGSFDELLTSRPGGRKRKKHRARMRKLEDIGPVETVIPVDAREAAATLETFFAFKAERFKDAGIHDVFADAEARAALVHMFGAAAQDQQHTHELFKLMVGGETAAIMGCTLHESRLTVEFSTFNPAFGHAGPGEVLFYAAVGRALERGLAIFDFGVGDEAYKRSWCDIETWHRDTFIAVSARGQLHRIAKTMRSGLVRKLKSNEQLWNAAKAARRRLGSVAG